MFTLSRQRLLSSTIPIRHASSKSSKEWLSRQARDHFVKQRNLGGDPDSGGGSFRARSAFKLIELNEKYRLLVGANIVVDLGGAPGGWSQVVAGEMRKRDTRFGNEDDVQAPPTDANTVVEAGASTSPVKKSKKRILAVDLLPIAPMAGVTTIQGDFLALETQRRIIAAIQPDEYVDVVLSDMAPNMSGNRLRDIDQSLELCTSAFRFAQDWLVTAKEAGRPHGGVLV